MTGLVRAEVLKVTSTRTWIVVCCGAVVLVLANLAIAAVFAGWQPPGAPTPPGLDSAAGLRSMYAAAAGGTVFAVLLGVLGVTTEYRHGTATATFLGTPRRNRVTAAKLLAYLLAGAVLGVLVAVVCVLGAEVALLVGAEPVPPLRYGTAALLGGTVLSYALHAVVGVGVGSLVHHQVAAVVGVVVWTQVVEAATVALLPGVGRWLLTGAGSAVVRYGESTGLQLLPAWAGALLLLGYGTLFALLAAVTTTRRDVA